MVGQFRTLALAEWSVANFAFQVAPGLEWTVCGRQGQMAHRDAAHLRRLGDLCIDEAVVEAGGGGVEAVAGEVDFLESGPVNRSQAHRAGFATGVENAVGQLKVGQRATGETNGHDFGMRRRVQVAGDAVAGGGDDCAVSDDQRAKRAAALLDVVPGQFDRLA